LWWTFEVLMLVIKNAAQLVAAASRQIILDGAVIAEGPCITWVGPTTALPLLRASATVIDASGRTVLPGFIDSHTHLVFAGSRENEFEQRLRGKSYQDIGSQGGGILSTVRRVRESSKAELKELARPRLQRLLNFGVTTVEVKSGYGLSLADEVKCLEA